MLAFCLTVFLRVSCVLSASIPSLKEAHDAVQRRRDPSSATTSSAIPIQMAEANSSRLRIVENSGICETTPGVYQASGYCDLTQEDSMWFWFFEARENPDTAPLALWFNGGPGASSMTGLFQENGPCRINNDSKTVSLNEYSWNNKVNMLYIDQPIGVGFSSGQTLVTTSQQAAADVWTFLQLFLEDEHFQKYQNTSLGL